MEGSADRKISNSPWNLQVIARSLGSLTRFMPDDIPGVTSPMVYIGMLFSWFAWHVEDHELHSMNFLHTGSRKTWYAVPGDSAFAFEEVICSQAYGENVDRLAALTVLGEKTTLLSPEVLIDSSIPCCRLVQNPGEFVVTFPRAYHVGFSHGFNCGEAANFGTVKWLEVAKEAAVRRAAMNYLPMLSHQQLLYLLTMSFVSGVPRSLLPGARSSRMRDRQKDERELSIKKAFLDDVLSENRLLTIILKRSGSDRVVLWDLESLPSLTKVPELCSTSSTVVTAPKDNASSENENKNNQDLLRDMSLYMETVNDLYMDDSDLSGDFQLDSGSLPCVACGILGFPFMTVVQPSERASVNLLQDVGVSKHDHSPSPLANGLVDPVPDGVRENIEPYGCNLLHHLNGELASQFENEWCSTRDFLRPRIFCLEHAIHIVDILDCRGGANVLVICHSDFKKMRAHAAVISEQIGTPFRYYEALLDNATQGDLNLIDLAVDNEEHNKYGKDWTSKVNINLQHCVKLRKSFPCKQEHQYALALGGLFSETKSSSETTDLNWQFTKSRSKCNRKKSFDPIRMEKPSMGSSTESMLRGNDQVLVVQSVANIIKDEVKLIQYSRRRFNCCKPGSSISNETVTEQDCDVAPVVDSGNQNEYDIERSLKGLSVETLSTGDKSSGLSIPIYNGNPEFQSGSGVSVSSQTVCSVTPGTQNVEANSKDPTTVEDLDMHHEIKVDKICLNIGTFDAENSSFSVVAAAEDTQHSIVQKENVGFLGNGEDQSSEGIMSRKGTAEDRGEEPVEANNNAPSDQSSLVSNVSIEVSITNVVLEIDNDGYHSSLDKGELDNAGSTMVCQKPNAKKRSKRRRESDLLVDNQKDFDSFIRSPCEGLRPRSSKHAKKGEKDSRNAVKENPVPKKTRKSLNSSVISVSSKHRKSHWCDVENCSMKFHTKEKLSLHKGNRCPIKGCGKRFSSHKYTVLHQRVHDDDRPLKCPWKGCDMSFKWAWSRIEHIRLHTGERPYCCKVDGCGLTFRFISDFSRHRRKTGHYVTLSA